MKIPDLAVVNVNDLNKFGHGFVLGRTHFQEELDTYYNALASLDHLVKLRGQWKERMELEGEE